MSVLIIVAIAIGAIAVDFAHVLTVRNELQNAADAAALAGAQDLIFEDRDAGDATEHALAVAETNQADKRDVSNSSPGTTVSVSVDDSPAAGEPATVEVNSQMTISHLLAPIIGRRTDQVSVTSRAGGYRNINILREGQGFPIAVSIDQWPNGPQGHDKPVNQLHIGDDILIVIKPSGDRNAAWTSFNLGSANTNTYRELLNQNIGEPSDLPPSLPRLEAGVTEIALDNGLNQGADLDGHYATPVKNKPFIIVPAITGDRYNQHTVVRGFITVKVERIQHSAGKLEIEGKLVKGLVRGWGGDLPSSGNGNNDHTLEEMTPGVVKLLSAEAH